MARRGEARQAGLGAARRGKARHGRQGMELKEVDMNTERKDDGLDAAWCAFDAAVERRKRLDAAWCAFDAAVARLKRAVGELEHVLGRKVEDK